MWLRRVLLLALFVSFSALALAQDSDTITSIDQALQELSIIEQNQIALKLLLTEREVTIVEKEQLLSQMTLQFQNLEASFLLSESVNKVSRKIIIALGVLVIGETLYITGDTVLNWW